MFAGKLDDNSSPAETLTISTPLRAHNNSPSRKYDRTAIRRSHAFGNLAWFAILLIIVAFVFTMVLRG
jgi:hypothetical protein